MASNLYFNSNEEIDKVIYTHNGSASVPNDGSSTTTFAHDVDYPFLPLVSYSWDGSNWYSDMGTSWGFYSLAGVYVPNVTAYVTADDDDVVIHWQNGPLGAKTVQYRVIGISRD